MFNIEGMYCSIKRDSTFLTVMTKTQGLSSEVLCFKADYNKTFVGSSGVHSTGFCSGSARSAIENISTLLNVV